MEVDEKCGCKGIRTCLICEKEGNLSRNDDKDIKETVQYRFCPWCGLCWPVEDTAAGPPLYLGLLTLIPEFVTSEEEEEFKVAIDCIEWMPSQSGRRKQDFGPKVNFKKKKSKVGNFKGFPRFTELLLKRFEQCADLSDFQPVELCHLDYDPDRGSAIEPHIDDTWIWGERLVTLNLVSSTVLTLTPTNGEGPCDCQTHCLKIFKSPMDENRQCLNVSAICIDENECNPHRNTDVGCTTIAHVTPDVIGCQSSSKRIGQNSATESLGCPSKNHTASLSSVGSVKGNNDHDQPSCTICKIDLCHHNATPGQDDCTITKNGHCSLNDPLHTKCSKDIDAYSVNHLKVNNLSLGTAFKENPLDKKICNSPEDIEQKTQFPQNKLYSHNTFPNCAHRTFLNGGKSITVKDMCTFHRIGNKQPNIEVLVPLPARSLLVLAGCSRHNWFHEIKRKDVLSRRLAMTFRELAQDFMPGGSEEHVGSPLLELGRTFWETNSVGSS